MNDLLFVINSYPVHSAVIVGLMVGSFLNVLICRIPAMEWAVSSIYKAHRENLYRPSACPHCARKVRPWENIPVLSYLLLRGKCKGCGTGIGLLYPVIELATAIASGVFVYWALPAPGYQIVVALCLLWTLVPLVYILITKARVSALLSVWAGVFMLLSAGYEFVQPPAEDWTIRQWALTLVALGLIEASLRARRANKRAGGLVQGQDKVVPRTFLLTLLVAGGALQSSQVMAIILAMALVSVAGIASAQILDRRIKG